MTDESMKNAGRFDGLAEDYEDARPSMPPYAVELVRRYLGCDPMNVVDLGCGTGLSTLVWKGRCRSVTGVDPNPDMLAVARKKQTEGIVFVQAFGHDTGLPEGCADAVMCSQSFHWMEPEGTLCEIGRLLRPGGVFATVDCDWPPVSDWSVEAAYEALFDRVSALEQSDAALRGSFHRWNKEEHLCNIRNSGYFRYTREIVFSNREPCDGGRLVRLALSQGGLRGVLRERPDDVAPQLQTFKCAVRDAFGDVSFTVDFGYRVRIGKK